MYRGIYCDNLVICMYLIHIPESASIVYYASRGFIVVVWLFVCLSYIYERQHPLHIVVRPSLHGIFIRIYSFPT